VAAGAKPGSKLQSRTPEEYGEKYQDHLLEQYKLFVETSQHVSDRRQNANNYLLTLNSSLVTLFVAFLSTFGVRRYDVLIPITGCVVCFVWYSLVDSYKDLNTAKFAVIHELENQLPVALFRHEWWVCGHNRQKKDKPVEDMYVPLTHLERWIPVAFVILYIGLGLYAVLTSKATKKSQTSSESHASFSDPKFHHAERRAWRT
jgi:hypothetical protein